MASTIEQDLAEIRAGGGSIEDDLAAIRRAVAEDTEKEALLERIRRAQEGAIAKPPGPLPGETVLEKLARLVRLGSEHAHAAGVSALTGGAFEEFPREPETLAEKIVAFPSAAVGTVAGFKGFPGAEPAWELLATRGAPMATRIAGTGTTALSRIGRAAIPQTIPGATVGAGEDVITSLMHGERPSLGRTAMAGAQGALGGAVLGGTLAGAGEILGGLSRARLAPKARAVAERPPARAPARTVLPKSATIEADLAEIRAKAAPPPTEVVAPVAAKPAAKPPTPTEAVKAAPEPAVTPPAKAEAAPAGAITTEEFVRLPGGAEKFDRYDHDAATDTWVPRASKAEPAPAVPAAKAPEPRVEVAPKPPAGEGALRLQEEHRVALAEAERLDAVAEKAIIEQNPEWAAREREAEEGWARVDEVARRADEAAYAAEVEHAATTRPTPQAEEVELVDLLERLAKSQGHDTAYPVKKNAKGEWRRADGNTPLIDLSQVEVSALQAAGIQDAEGLRAVLAEALRGYEGKARTHSIGAAPKPGGAVPPMKEWGELQQGVTPHELRVAAAAIRARTGVPSELQLASQAARAKKKATQAAAAPALFTGRETLGKQQLTGKPLTAGAKAPDLELQVEGYKPPKAPTAAGELPGVEGGPSLAARLPRPLGRGSAPTEPVKISAIVKDLDRALAPIRTGRFLGRRTGVFKGRERVIRVRKANELSTVAHEAGHAALKPLIGGRPALVPHAAELKPLAYKGAKDTVNEGYAEFVRLWLTDPAQAQAKAPNFNATFEGALNRTPEIGEVFRKAQRDFQRWNQQPDEAKVLSTLSVGEPATERKWTVRRLYTELINSLAPLEAAEKEIVGGRRAPASESAISQAELLKGMPAKADVWVRNGITDALGNKTGPSLNERLAPVANDLDGFRAYAVARHGLERIAALGEKAMPLEKATYEAVVKQGAQKYQPVLDSLVEYQDALLADLVDAGMLSAEGKAAMRAKYPNHVSLYRVMEGQEAPGLGKRVGNVPQAIKRAKGSGRDIIDPIESLVKDTYEFISIAQRGRVLRNLTRLAEGAEGKGRLVEEIPMPGYGRKVTLEELLNARDAKAAEEAGLDLEKAHTIFQVTMPGRANIVRVFHEGKPRYYQLDAELYNAVMNLDTASSNLIIHALSTPASILRAGATLTPEFGLRNPFKDIFTALINSRYGMTPVDFVRGLAQVIKRGEAFNQFLASGAGRSALVSMDRSMIQSTLRNMGKSGPGAKIIDAVRHPIDAWRAFGETTEYATRVGEFGKGTKWGRETNVNKVMEAALAARDVTLDFSRTGNTGKIANRLAAFFNANVQDLDKIRRQVQEHPAQWTARGFAYITVPTISLFLANRDNPLYQERPEWEKDAYWFIPTPGGELIRLPKPFTLGIIFGAVPERLLRKFAEHDPHAFDDFANNLARALFPNPMPTVIAPYIGWVANRSFTGKPVVPRGQLDLPPEEQVGPATTGTALWLGRKLKLSPRKLDALITGYAGGMGRYAAQAGGGVLRAVGALEEPAPEPTPVLGQRPVVRAFVVNKMVPPVQVERFYDEYTKLQMKAARAKSAGTPLTPTEDSYLKHMKLQAEALGGLRKLDRAIRADMKMTPNEKRDALLGLVKMQGDVADGTLGYDRLRELQGLLRKEVRLVP